MSVQDLSQVMSSQIVNCLVLGLALTALATTVQALLKQHSSGTRFAVWFSALLTIAALFLSGQPVLDGASAVHRKMPEISLPSRWALYIFLIWAGAATLGIARVLRGLWRLHTMKRECLPPDASVLNTLEPTLASARARRFSLLISASARIPAAIGFFHPAVVLPAWTIRELSSEELNAIVLHEAAHLERWDDWTNLAQKIIRALLFFHPAVWWIDSRLSIEREMSCDDAVLVRSQNPRRYAACLISVAEKASAYRSLALAQAAVSRLRHMAQRIAKILDGKKRKPSPALKPTLAALTAFGAIGFVAVQHAPQLVSFRGNPGAATAAARGERFDYVARVDGPSAKAIPASMRIPASYPASGNTAIVGRTTPASAAAKTNRERRRLEPNSANQEARTRLENTRPAVANASLSRDVVPGFVYVVTQSERYDGFGNVIVMTSVWQIRVVSPSPAEAQSAAAAHQI
jgi:beta-lactamase regulating signal transducer with metallopeptidase domain